MKRRETNYYYDVNKEGKVFITSNKPNKTTTEKIRDWFVDKWHWLLTFNDAPTVTIDFDRITIREGEPHVVKANGRVNLNFNGNIISYKSKEEMEHE